MILSILLLIAITIFCLVNYFRNHRDITSTFAALFYRSCDILFPNHHIWKSLPPGPSGWPLLGNAFQLDGEKPHETLTEWARTYGDLYSISMYGRPVVVANSDASIREIFISRSSDYAGRPSSYRAQYLLDFKDDIAFTSAKPAWSMLKKTTMYCLKKCQEDVDNEEDEIHQVVDDLIKQLQNHPEEAFDPVENIHDSITTMITHTLYGHHLDKADIQDLNYVEANNNNIVKADGNGAELDVFPWLRFLPSKNFALLKAGKRIRDKWFRGRVRKLRETYDPDHNRGIIDELFTYRRKAKHQNNHNGIKLTDDHIEMIERNLVFAGMTTTSRAVYALFLLLADNQSAQRTAQKHIHDVIGSRSPRISDKVDLPYIESMTLELLRYITHLPIGVPHVALVDTKLGDFNIPKGTEVWPNMWNLHHSTDYWEEPWKFKPDRFLAPDGTLLSPTHPIRKRLLPFGAGRRVCVGEKFARHRMFIMITSLIQRLNFRSDPTQELPNPDPRGYKLGFVLHPPNYKVIVESRAEKHCQDILNVL